MNVNEKNKIISIIHGLKPELIKSISKQEKIDCIINELDSKIPAVSLFQAAGDTRLMMAFKLRMEVEPFIDALKQVRDNDQSFSSTNDCINELLKLIETVIADE